MLRKILKIRYSGLLLKLTVLLRKPSGFVRVRKRNTYRKMYGIFREEVLF